MLDAPGLLLLLIVLIPRGRFPAIFAAARKHRWRAFVVGLLPGLLLGPIYVFIAGMVLFYIVAFLELVERFRRAPDAGSCVVPWLVWGAIWGVLLTMVLGSGGGGAQGTVDVWLIDAFNRLFFTLIHPLIVAAGLEEALLFVLEAFLPVLRFIGDNLVGMAFVLNLIFVAILYEVVRGRDPSLPPRFAHLQAELPRWVAPVVVVLWASRRAGLGGVPLDALWQMLIAFVCVAGLRLLYAFAIESALLRGVFWASAAVAVLEPQVFLVPVALALLDPFVGLTALAHTGRLHTRPWPARVETGLSAIRRATSPATVLVASVLFALPGSLLSSSLDQAAVRSPPATEAGDTPAEIDGMVAVPVEGGWFRIDRYPHPNRAGEPATVGLSGAEAELACGAEGKRLCSAAERGWACSAGGTQRYPLEIPADADAPNLVLTKVCNLGQDALTPLGAEPGCVNALGVADLAGKVWEWVSLPDRPGVAALTGSEHRNQDDATTRCSFSALVADPQLPLVDLSRVGFRCCG